MISPVAAVEDLAYTAYQQRQQQAVSAEAVVMQAQRVKPSGHFLYRDGQWQPQEYKGFAVVSMVGDNAGNEALQQQLAGLQQQLCDRLGNPGAYFPLPADSFHQTVANTLSDDRFKQQLLQTGRVHDFPALVQAAFAQTPSLATGLPIEMMLTGLSVFGTSIGLLGVLAQEADYERITHFRRHLYGNPALAALDVRMTRPFIGHITLAYVEQAPDAAAQAALATVVNDLNQQLQLQPLTFRITQTALRYYDHLAQFERVPHDPSFFL